MCAPVDPEYDPAEHDVQAEAPAEREKSVYEDK